MYYINDQTLTMGGLLLLLISVEAKWSHYVRMFDSQQCQNKEKAKAALWLKHYLHSRPFAEALSLLDEHLYIQSSLSKPKRLLPLKRIWRIFVGMIDVMFVLIKCQKC